MKVKKKMLISNNEVNIIKNNIVHGDYKMKLSEEFDYQGAHFKIFRPEYNEIQQKERDSYIQARLSEILRDQDKKDDQ